MKKLLLLLLCVPLIGLGQEVITNKNGEKILLKIDGTWEYLNSMEKDGTGFGYDLETAKKVDSEVKKNSRLRL